METRGETEPKDGPKRSAKVSPERREELVCTERKRERHEEPKRESKGNRQRWTRQVSLGLDAGRSVSGDVPSVDAGRDEASTLNASDRVRVGDRGAVLADFDGVVEEERVGDGVGVEGLKGRVRSV